MVIAEVIPMVPMPIVVIMPVVMIVPVPPIFRERQVLAVAFAIFLPVIANLIRSHQPFATLPLAGPIAMIGLRAELVIRCVLAPILILAIHQRFVEFSIARRIVPIRVDNARAPIVLDIPRLAVA